MNPRSSRATHTLEPVRPRPGADEHEARVDLLDRVAAVRVANAQGAQAAVALRGHRLAPGAHLDVVERLDLLDQVVRHRLRQRVAADEHRHPACVRGEVYGRLAGGVGPADHDDVLVLAFARVGQGGAVVDALTGQLGESRRVQLAVGNPRSDQNASTR